MTNDFTDYMNALETMELAVIESKGKWLSNLEGKYWIPECHRQIKVSFSLHTVRIDCMAMGCPNYMVIG